MVQEIMTNQLIKERMSTQYLYHKGEEMVSLYIFLSIEKSGLGKANVQELIRYL
jgi:hypothetical protein